MIRGLLLFFLVSPLLSGQDDPLSQKIGPSRIRQLQNELGSLHWDLRQRSMNRSYQDLLSPHKSGNFYR
ncbi:MAG: hypothetical protein QF752_12720 [Planctomycetota bacterium]|nr:hypothetical protein [Planctomycetota bacterium]